MNDLIKLDNQELENLNFHPGLIFEFQCAINTANKYPEMVSELQEYLNQHPELWLTIKPCIEAIRQTLIEKITDEGGSQLFIQEELKELKRELQYARAPLLEKLVIDLILMCWLRVQYAESNLNSYLGDPQSAKHVENADKMVTKAHNRYLKTIQTLSRLRLMGMKISTTFTEKSVKRR
jgi:hypothetical protein